MRNPRDFFKPLALDAPDYVTANKLEIFDGSSGTLPSDLQVRDYDLASYDAMGGPTTWPHS